MKYELWWFYDVEKSYVFKMRLHCIKMSQNSEEYCVIVGQSLSLAIIGQRCKSYGIYLHRNVTNRLILEYAWWINRLVVKRHFVWKATLVLKSLIHRILHDRVTLKEFMKTWKWPERKAGAINLSCWQFYKSFKTLQWFFGRNTIGHAK